MSHNDIICGLDIGSTAIRVVVGQRVASENSGDQLQIVGAAEVPSDGVNKGVITGIEDAVSSIASCFEKAERLCGLPIEHSFVSISGTHIISQPSKGVVAVSKANGEISEDDVERVIEAAQAVATPPNYEILHVIPRSFVVDSQAGIKDPVGMTGVRLEVEAQIIQGLSTQIKNLTKAVYRTGVDINDLVLSPLAASESVLTKRQKELGVALINIGATTTGLIVLEEGDVLHTAILPIGSTHITSDIAIGLRTSIDIAENIKIEQGSALPQQINKKEEIDLKNYSEAEDAQVSKKHVAEIIEARLEEIYDMVDKELKKINRSGLLPAGIVLTGGGAKLDGLVEVAKKKFKLPASIGYPKEVTSAIDKIRDPAFTVSLGLVIWGNQRQRKKSKLFIPNFSSVEEITGKIRKWFKSLVT